MYDIALSFIHGLLWIRSRHVSLRMEGVQKVNFRQQAKRGRLHKATTETSRLQSEIILTSIAQY